MQDTIKQAIQAKLQLKNQIIQIDAIQNQIKNIQNENYTLTKKEIFLEAQKYLLQQKLDICSHKDDYQVQQLEQLVKQMQNIDESLSEILMKQTVNDINDQDLELVKLLDDVI